MFGQTGVKLVRMSPNLDEFTGCRNFVWQAKKAKASPLMPEALVGESATLLGSHIYLCLGEEFESASNNRVLRLDYRKGEWQVLLTDPKFTTSQHTASLVNDLIYVIGGVGAEMYECIQVQVFDTTLCEWRLVTTTSTVPLTSFGLVDHTADYVPSLHQVFIFGGQLRPDENSSVLSDLLLVFDLDTSSFVLPKTVGEPPQPRYHHCSCQGRSTLFIYGGCTYSHGSAYGDLYALSLKGQQLVWSKLKGYLPRANCSAALVLGKIFVFGGSGVSKEERLLVYETEQGKWSTVRNNRSAMSQVSAYTVAGRVQNMSRQHSIYVDGRIIVLGGLADTTPVPLTRMCELRCVPNDAGLRINTKIMDLI